MCIRDSYRPGSLANTTGLAFGNCRCTEGNCTALQFTALGLIFLISFKIFSSQPKVTTARRIFIFQVIQANLTQLSSTRCFYRVPIPAIFSKLRLDTLRAQKQLLPSLIAPIAPLITQLSGIYGPCRDFLTILAHLWLPSVPCMPPIPRSCPIVEPYNVMLVELIPPSSILPPPWPGGCTVSYTHLTLPTKRIV